MKDHEKFIAFCLLGAALMVIVVMLRVWPLAANSPSLQLLNMIVGAFIGGFGAAVQKLLQASEGVTVENKADEPIPTAPQNGVDVTPVEELPDYAR